jgi:recombinational DNA repair protein RecT
MKQAHIVPFYNNKTGKRDAQFIPGYVGLNQMAMRTGKYRVLNCSYIREGQVIDIDELTGIPTIHGKREGDTILGYFHYFELFDGFKHILYMTVEELHAHGNKYAAKNPMWKNSFDAMARKTVTRLHLLKNGILDPYDRSMVEAASEEIEPDSTIINREDTVDASFTEADDETAAIEAAAQKVVDANKPLPTEEETLKAMGIEPDKKPAWTPAAELRTEPAQPAAPSDETEHVVYSETPSKTVGYCKHNFPGKWMATVTKYVAANKLNAFEVAGIMWNENIPETATADEVIAKVQAHLDAKPA